MTKDNRMQPIWSDGIPVCSEECPSYDGKRCELLGSRPSHICEPMVATLTSHAGDQPTGTELRVCQDIAARQQLGIAKYGVTVEGNPLSLKEWLQHAYCETLDKAVYLKRAIEEMERGPAVPKEIEDLVLSLREASKGQGDGMGGVQAGTFIAVLAMEAVIKQLKEKQNANGGQSCVS